MYKTKVLDFGFVELLNISGPVRRTTSEEDIYTDLDGSPIVRVEDLAQFDASDIDPAITARISFNNFGENRTYEQDMKLVSYLIDNKHSSPLEFIETWWEIKLPIFVARQFHRHRTQSINEQSGRYSTLAKEWYIPEIVGGKSKSNKQGQEDNLDLLTQKYFKEQLESICAQSYSFYKEALIDGVAPEHARLFLHLNHYTHYVFKMNLHNLMHFLTLRLDKHAQIEAREYAKAIKEILDKVLPGIMKLFDEKLK